MSYSFLLLIILWITKTRQVYGR